MSEPIFLPVEDKPGTPPCLICGGWRQLVMETKVYHIGKLKYPTQFQSHKCVDCGHVCPTIQDGIVNDNTRTELFRAIFDKSQAALPMKLFRRGAITVIVAAILMHIANLLLATDSWHVWYVMVFGAVNMIVGFIGIFMIYSGLRIEHKRHSKEQK